jgi:hypothetical protein
MATERKISILQPLTANKAMSAQASPAHPWDGPRASDRHHGAPLVLVHPPALSKRYLPTKVLPYGMAVLHAYLKTRGIPVQQHELLAAYLHHSPKDPDYHNPEQGFSQEEYLDCLQGRRNGGRLDDFAAKYADKLPDTAAIYAFSIMAYPQYWASLLLARRLKRRNPGSLIVFGGPYITIKPNAELAAYGGADLWIKGNGETPLAVLYQMSQKAGGIVPREVPGACYLSDGKLHQNPPARLPAQDECAPDFGGLDLQSYRMRHPVSGRNALFLPYRITKGCVSRCSFCTGRLVDGFESKPLEKIVTELERLARDYHSRDFMFCDASINADPALLAGLCRRLSKALPGMSWYAYARVQGFSRRLLWDARRAGCFSLFWGVDAMHQPTVRLLGKGFKVSRVPELLAECRELGIESHLHLMYHTPHESPEDARALRSLVEAWQDSPGIEFALHRFLLEPGSLMARHPGDFGLCDLSPAPRDLFERPHLMFGETTGLSPEAIKEREEMIKDILGPLLEQLLKQDAKDRLPAPLL